MEKTVHPYTRAFNRWASRFSNEWIAYQVGVTVIAVYGWRQGALPKKKGHADTIERVSDGAVLAKLIRSKAA